ncbi:cation-translocating P-type ATPase [Arthrobacter sp. Sa2CUA1]|uniref:Cation-translocating P-type ATPase n=1 Tax=Arthrobacter gallicola TaxID=2762225 RepID=A0ABR8UNI2_9MICC|nr:cation-translocating P-type ATPase [Arthrobacter gallicola]MBD7994115.1 cation-translocating P-type ATPase [Arthrobacter gallicola]
MQHGSNPDSGRSGADAPSSTSPSVAQAQLPPPWTVSGPAAAKALETSTETGLSEQQAAERLSRYGPNQLAGAPAVPAWRKILALLSDRLILVLLAAAVLSAVVSRDLETPIVILAVVILNTILNYVQERRAENSLEALRRTDVGTARVRRGGSAARVPRTDLVPGDIVLLEAGDSVPADGRLLEAVRLQAAEAALTGESQPVNKDAAAVQAEDVPVADRRGMLYMGTDISRGRAVLVVTSTGMDTQMGRIAHLLGSTADEKTTLQRSIDQLAALLTWIALGVVALVFVLGLLRGEDLDTLLLTSVSLAVATIPEGLTAVVAFTLAMGASRLAARGAIIKQLSAVETLGGTSQICTDKTGTLTLNEMTARQIISASGRQFRVTGTGYGIDGRILSPDGLPVPALTEAYLVMVLCNDAAVTDGVLTGDPTEGALVVLAEKGGLDPAGARSEHPRAAEIPFDSDYKYMATFNDNIHNPGAVYCNVKGAPGVVLDLCSSMSGPEGVQPITARDRERLQAGVTALADQGLRTLAVAGRPLNAPLPDTPAGLKDAARDLVLFAVVGIMDPPRAEAREAIATAHAAGIRVHMITGDHLVTASAIAKDLGISGNAVAGAELDRFTEQELRERVAGYGVLARVSPEHKLRVVEALQANGDVVAMTGDGVNDAPALKRADIGIAMGITGTDVSKGAARMILTDDNFATIVAAVEEGRGIYANILKFVRFQLTTAWGFVLIFLAAATFGFAGGAPFTAIQILWVNIIMDGPPALALGVDATDPKVMQQPPRKPREPLLTGRRLASLMVSGLVMAAGTCAVLLSAPELFPGSAAASSNFATTMAFTTFVFFQVFNLLNVRSETSSLFSLQTFTNRTIWLALGAVVVLQILVVQVGVFGTLFDTVPLTADQWLLCIGVAAVIVVVSELSKAAGALRRRRATRVRAGNP